MQTIPTILYIIAIIIFCRMFRRNPVLLVLAITLSSLFFFMSLEPLAPNDGLNQGIKNHSTQ